MKANIKRYLKANPILIAPLNITMIDLLKASHLEVNEIAIMNVHNYLNNLKESLKAKVQP